MKLRSYLASLNVGLLGTAIIATSAVSIYASAPTPAPTAIDTSSVVVVAQVPQDLVQAVHRQVNQYRQQKKLSPLRLDARISQQALAHSQAMASGRAALGHEGFQQRIQTIGRVIPYSRAAENVSYNMGYASPDRQAVQGWLNSPGHLKNIEATFDTTGIGIAHNAKGQYFFTQIFLQRR